MALWSLPLSRLMVERLNAGTGIHVVGLGGSDPTFSAEQTIRWDLPSHFMDQQMFTKLESTLQPHTQQGFEALIQYLLEGPLMSTLALEDLKH